MFCATMRCDASGSDAPLTSKIKLPTLLLVFSRVLELRTSSKSLPKEHVFCHDKPFNPWDSALTSCFACVSPPPPLGSCGRPRHIP